MVKKNSQNADLPIIYPKNVLDKIKRFHSDYIKTFVVYFVLLIII